MAKLTVICRAPGMHRAGRSHPAIAEHDDDAFTAEQLEELLDDPQFHVVHGEIASRASLLEKPSKKAKA